MSGKTSDRDPWGPFRTEDDAFNAPGMREMRGTALGEERRTAREAILSGALADGHVVIGAFDADVVTMLCSSEEATTLATIARWVRAAYEAGRASGGEDA